MTLATGTRLGPYEILAPLGAGGMGEVYRARDSRLGRDVAVKVLPAELSSDGERLRRFEKEAKAASALNHPNILTVHDIGAQDGVPYVVSELLEGETLRDRLASGAFSPRKAIDDALQIAHGLAAAHEKGIVHRDLKPENLFVTKDGRIKILDFGLAKLTQPETPGVRVTENSTLSAGTEPGVVLGTLGYMSPEQVRGQPTDPRSDIFSFGAILYEMLSGRRAFQGRSAADTMSAILREDPPELSESGRNVPAALEHIVQHCLEKDRDNRFQSAKDIVFNLSEQSSPTVTSGPHLAAPPAGKRYVIIAAVAALLLAIAGVFLLQWLHKSAGEAAGVKRVAVLPFENLGTAEDDYFADGISDAIRGKLTSLLGVEVIARASSMPYKKTTKAPKQVAQELNVRYLLTATVRWQKAAGVSRVQVSPELVEVKESGAPTSKWQQPFDAALADVFLVQSDIATRVAQALGVALGAGEEKRLGEKPTQNLLAYDAFLKGEEVWHSMAADPASLRRALGFYEQAVALDPGFEQAWAQVSHANSILFANSIPVAERAEYARRAAEKAIALAPDRPEGYLALGDYQRAVVHDFSRAIEQFSRAQRLAPGNVSALRGVALVEENLGRWEAAVEQLRQAERLDPRSVHGHFALGDALLHLRRYSEAREAQDRGLALAPDSLALIMGRALTFLAEGDLAGARSVLKAVPKGVEPTALVAYLANYGDLAWVLDEEQLSLLLRLTPSAFDDDRGVWGICLAQAYALKRDAAGLRSHAEEARRAFEDQLRTAPQDATRHVVLGLALAYLGRKQDAVQEGERGVALMPVTKDAYFGPAVQHQLARIYIFVGEPEKALDRLEPLLKIPYVLSPGWLKIDPDFDPVRNNPRFQRLVGSGK
jgi:TolB-like protein/tetratricopeptide (TPR) repeat protein